MPPLTGILGADFSEFDRAVQGSSAQLKAFEGKAGSVQTTLTQVGTQADQTTRDFGNMKSMALSLAGAFGISFGIAGLVQFGRQVFTTASQLQDMSLKLGISAEAVQGFQYAAEQSGGTIDQVGVAINKMNMNLAGGDKATVQALKSAGLEFRAIRTLAPEDAFLAIADAIRQVEDPMTRADVAMQLFGKGGSAILPAIMDDFRKTADSAIKWSNDTTKALADAEDAWRRLATNVTIYSGNMIAAIGEVGTATTHLNTWQKALAVVSEAATQGWGAAGRLAVGLDQVSVSTQKAAAAQRPVQVELGLTADELGEVAKMAKEQERAAQEAAEWAAKMAKAEKDLYSDMRHWGVKELRAMTEEVNKELSAQRQLVTDAQLAILGQVNDANAKRHVAALGGAQSLDAQLEALAAQHQIAMQKIEADGQMASSRGGTAWLEMATSLARDEEQAFNEAWQAIVSGSQAAEAAAVPALGAIGDAATDAADKATAAASAIMSIATVNPATGEGMTGTNTLMASYLSQGYSMGEAMSLAGGFGTNIGAAHGYWDATGWHERRAAGGPVSAGQSYLVGEKGPELFTPKSGGSILPNGAGGGLAIQINVTQPLGTPDAIARAVGDAFMGWMRSQGMRVPSGA